MNEKILYQLLDVARDYSPATRKVAESLILQLLCWWKLSKEGVLPQSVLFGTWASKPFPNLIEALREAQLSLPYPFIDEGAWQSLPKLNDLRPVTEKIIQLEAQGFLESLDLQDAAFWLSDKFDAEVAMSPSLADLVIGLAKLQKDQRVYVPWERSGQISTRVAKAQFSTWIETQTPILISTILCSAALKNWSLHVTDPIFEPSALVKGQLSQFDSAICFPPMGIRYRNEVVSNDLLGRFVEKSLVGSVLQIRHLLAQVKGRIVIVMNNSILYGTGSERQLREHLVNNGQIETVISLPAALCTLTNIPVTVLVLNTAESSQSIRFVNADVDEFRMLTKKRSELINLDHLLQLVGSSEQTETAASIASEIIEANDFNLDVSRYVLDDKARKLSAVLKKYPLAHLGNFVEIIRPRQHATAATGTQVLEVQTHDLPDFGYLTNAGKEALFDLGSPKADTYFLQENDVLLTFRGAIGKVAIVGKTPRAGEGGWIAGQSLLILRCGKHTEYPPEALVIYLRSEMGQALLNRMAVGVAMSSIQISALKELEIPILTAEELDRMRQVFEQEAKIQNEILHLRDKQSALAARFWHL